MNKRFDISIDVYLTVIDIDSCKFDLSYNCKLLLNGLQV